MKSKSFSTHNNLYQLSDAVFRERILNESPDIENALKRGHYFEATCLLREWVYQVAHISSIETQTALNMPQWAVDVDAALSLALFDANELAVQCHGLSMFLMRIYHMFGFDAGIYNFGDRENELTHVVTLVTMPSQDKVIVQDADFNGYWCWDDCDVFDFCKISPRFNGFDRITFESGKLDQKYFLSHTKLQSGIHKISEYEKIYSGVNHHLIHRYLKDMTWKNAENWLSSVREAKGLPFSSLFELAQFPIQYVGPGNILSQCIVSNLKALSEKNGSKIEIYNQIEPDIISSLPDKLLSSGLFKKYSHITVFGISYCGWLIYRALKTQCPEVLLADSYRYGPLPGGIVVLSPSDLIDQQPSEIVIICSFTHAQEIEESLQAISGNDTIFLTLENILSMSPS